MRKRRLHMALALLLLAAALCLRPTDDPFVSGPIVQQTGPDTTIVLLHGAARAPVLEFRVDGDGHTWRRVDDSGQGRRHRFRLAGLKPALEVVYRIRTRSGRELGSGRFRTAPRRGGGRVRFAAFGDSGALPWWRYVSDTMPFELATWLKQIVPGRRRQWQIGREVARQRPDLVLHLGDLVYPWGRREHYREALFEPFAQLLASSSFYPTFGNHDLLTDNGAPVAEFFELPGARGPSGGRYYDFVHGPVHFFCLDTFSEQPAMRRDSAQRKWLVARLAASRARWRIVFTHRPFWTASRSRRDNENKRLREEIHPLLARGGVTLVLSGHDHVYQRFLKRDGVTYVVAGGGGKSLYNLVEHSGLAPGAAARRFSFVLVDADTRSMHLEAIAANGQVLDSVDFSRL